MERDSSRTDTDRETRELEMIVSNYVRNQYEQKYKEAMYVPMVLKYIMMKFSRTLIGCQLLSHQQEIEFFYLLKKKLPNMHRIEFLFKASEHKYSPGKFHEFCDNKGATLTIIKSEKGNIFGGYTSKSLSSEYRQLMDSEAFVFLIKSDDDELNKKCPLRFKIKKDRVRHGVTSFGLWGPTFGSAIVIGGDRWNAYSHCTTSDYKGLDGMSLCGGTNINFVISDYEVFKISFLNC